MARAGTPFRARAAGHDVRADGCHRGGATTSLPETVGGERNWDYRYTWVRDASLTMAALWVAACPHEANKFFAFLANAASSGLQRGADLQIMFGVGGERDLSERELPHLAGWRGSRPVRVGNGAWLQRQLDVYGELLGAAATGRPARRAGSGHHTVPGRGRRYRRCPLAGEGPGDLGDPRRAARLPVFEADVLGGGGARAIALASQLGTDNRVADWGTARDEIRTSSFARGWNERAGAFTRAFGSEDLDSAHCEPDADHHRVPGGG